MKSLVVLLVLALSFSIHSIAAQGGAEYPNRNLQWAQADYVPGQLLVKFQEGVPESRINAINESLKVQVIRTLQAGRVYLIKVQTDTPLEDVRQAYFSFPEVESVNLNYKVRAD